METPTIMPSIPEGYFDTRETVIAPEYHVEEASAKLELYTLKEALADERIADMLAETFGAGVVPKPAMPWAKGLAIFAQPQIDEQGETFDHSAEIRTTVLTPAQDFITVIARTGARANIDLDIKGEGMLSRTLLVLAQEDVRLRIHSRAEEGAEGRVEQHVLVIAGAHSTITLEQVGIKPTIKSILAEDAEVIS